MTTLQNIGDLVATPFAWLQVQQFRKNAEAYLADSSRPNLSGSSVFLLAYECIHAASVGYLYAHGLAPAKGPGHRQQVLQLALQELGVPREEIDEVDAAHARRNETTYRSPAPPVSMQAAKDLAAIARRVLQVAKAELPDWFRD